MNSLLLSFSNNSLNLIWVFPCLIFGFLIAWFFYRKSSLENSRLKWLLLACRGIILSLLMFLLLGILIKSTREQLEKPLVIIAQDASESIKGIDSKILNLTTFQKSLNDLTNNFGEDVEVKVHSFGDTLSAGYNFKYNAKETNFETLFKELSAKYEGRNIGALVIVSDGNLNRGSNPIEFVKDISYPIYTVGLGDTIPKKDVVLSEVEHNNIVYLGSQHQLNVTLNAVKANNSAVKLLVKTSDGQTIINTLRVVADDWFKSIPITVAANKKGIQKIEIQTLPLAGEATIINNKQTVFVNVIDGREKILIAADAPHPDISAIKQAIESNKNYEVKLAYTDNLPIDVKEYGLIILHNLPARDASTSAFMDLIRSKSRWFIIGDQTNLRAFNELQNLVAVSNFNGAQQSYQPILNNSFYAFSISDEAKLRLQVLAPLTAPFGTYSLKSEGITLFDQRIGNIPTTAPLLCFGNDFRFKIGVLVGEGLWRWRIEDYARHENHLAVDELITKTIQYLNTRDDVRRFRVYSNQQRFQENQHIILNAELYNQNYELINQPDVNLIIQNKNGKKFGYLFSRKEQTYRLDAGLLPAGEYSYTAKTIYGGKNYLEQGQFIIDQLNIEQMHTAANHQLLYSLSKETDGALIMPQDINELQKLILANEKVKTISYEDEQYTELINVKWIFFLLMLLLTLEWVFRKRNGLV